MILGRAISSNIEERTLSWEEAQQWFQKTFFAGEALDVGIGSAGRLSPVSGAHRILTGAMGVLPIGLYQKVNGERHPANDEVLDWVLKIRANEDMSPSLANKICMSQCFWHGMGCFMIDKDALGRVTGLIPLPAGGSSVSRDPVTHQLWYTFVVDGLTRRFAPSELVITFFESYDGIHGRGMLDLARETIATDGMSQQYAKKFYQNGARLSGIVEVDTDASKETRGNIKEEFQSFATKDAFKVAVLDHSMKFTPIGLNQSDAQFIESRGFSVAEISRFSGVPEYMLQSGKQSYQSNEKQGLDFVTNTLMPHIVPKEQEMTYKLLTPEMLRKGYYFRINVAALLRGDNESRSRFYEKMIMNSVYCPDDCRAFEEMNPLPNGVGKKFFLTKNLDTVEHIVAGGGA